MNSIQKSLKEYAIWTIYFFLTVAISSVICYAQPSNQTININKMENNMLTIQKNKEVINTLFIDALNKRNFSLLREIVSEEYTGPQGKKGVEAFQQSLLGFIEAFPDVQWHMEEIICDGERCSAKWKVSGTQKGTFIGFEPHGETIHIDGVGSFELKKGKIVSSSILTDRLGLLQQLGILPENISSLSARDTNKEKVIFIDKFIIPSKASKEFYERVSINRAIIKKLPGFIKDEAYQHIDQHGNTICITIAQWESKKALEDAKIIVGEEYKRQGFNPAEMMERLGVTMEREVYQEVN
jgi:predicted ester cyclase